MIETSYLKLQYNNDILLKNILVMSVSSLTFFIIGYGFARNAKGGLMGHNFFAGKDFNYEEYINWLHYYSLCVTMASISTGSLIERVNRDTYVFFTFLTSSIVFPLALAWVWENGWLATMGF
jgi:Amt family ammonium transporter